MRRRRADRYDYAFTLIGLVFTFGFLAVVRERGASTLLSLILLVIVSIPVGLALGRLKHRLQSKRANAR